MKPYITAQNIILFIFGLLLVIRGIKAENDKNPPTSLQIGTGLPKMQLTKGVKHRVPEEECTHKTKNGDKLKMHYRYFPGEEGD